MLQIASLISSFVRRALKPATISTSKPCPAPVSVRRTRSSRPKAQRNAGLTTAVPPISVQNAPTSSTDDLFALEQALRGFEHYQQQMLDCDREIKRLLQVSDDPQSYVTGATSTPPKTCPSTVDITTAVAPIAQELARKAAPLELQISNQSTAAATGRSDAHVDTAEGRPTPPKASRRTVAVTIAAAAVSKQSATSTSRPTDARGSRIPSRPSLSKTRPKTARRATAVSSRATQSATAAHRTRRTAKSTTTTSRSSRTARRARKLSSKRR
jgi:hypothetical protein